MRIVIDLQGAQSHGSRNRGIGRYSQSLAMAIIKNKGSHEVIIALSNLFPDTIEPIKEAFSDIISEDNIHVWHSLDSVSHISPENSWRRNASELSREAFLTSLNPDIIYVTSLFEGLTDDAITSVGRLNQTTPTAVTLYDLIPLINRSPYLDNPSVESWYEGKLDQIRRADHLLAISQSSCQEGINYLGFPQDKSTNIGTAADSQFKRINISTTDLNIIRKRYQLNRPFLMYTGGIDHRKNIEGLIRAYALLPKSLRDKHQLAIVCSIHDDTRKILSELAKQQGLRSDELVLTGYIPEEDLIFLYNMCKAFIFPSWHEGFGLPALEAMCCGAAVIAANTSSLPEVVGKEDALFNPFDDTDISKKIEQVLTDSNFRNSLIKHSEIQSKKFSWDESAKKAINVFEKMHAEKNSQNLYLTNQPSRPTLAYISPLPPERTGIADYSAELLPDLARHYEIDVIIEQNEVSNPWIKENCSIKTVDWFKDNGHRYDRVLYHFGNSPFHQHMFELIKDIPGVAVLHDFFLGHVTVHMDGVADQKYLNILPKTLYHSHGYNAMKAKYHDNNIWNVAWNYPCSKTIFDDSIGVIVHSENSRRLTREWYGSKISDECSVIPLLRTPAINIERQKSRKKLGIDDNAFIVSSFGLLGESKLNMRLLDAWLKSDLSKNPNCQLLFVGENEGGEYGATLTSTIQNSGLSKQITITGWSDMKLFREYLAATDLAVQLRSLSRGETSAAVLDCMNYGLATIVNSHGSMADLPEDAVFMIPDVFDDADLINALETLWKNNNKRQKIGLHARALIHTKHAPRACADEYASQIEKYYIKNKICTNGLANAISKKSSGIIDDSTLMSISDLISRNNNRSSPKQLLLDISVLVQCDAKSGIQRVVRSILSELLENPPKGYRVEPVYANQNEPFRYARQFTTQFIGCPSVGLTDDTIEVSNQDIYLCLDLTHHVALSKIEFYKYLRQVGVQVNFVVYDLLPIYMPHLFPEGVQNLHQRWLELLAQTDGMLCISKSVADEVLDWLSVFGPTRVRPLKVGWFHLGADVSSSIPSTGLPIDADYVLDKLSSRPTFLSVGTIEPRKGQWQTLIAVEQLWAQGVDINLVLVGKTGWNVDKLIERLSSHPERNRRLFWLEGASDEYLERIYKSSSCLIAASEGEGFGLPLIEAAQNKIPIIARDIPVFREVAGNHASYFSGIEPDPLAEAIYQWLLADQVGNAPQADNLPWLSWKQSAQSVLRVVIDEQWYRLWMPDETYRFWGNDSRLGTQVGKRSGRDMVSTRQAGYMLFGPYISLPTGQYQVSVFGQVGKRGLSGAKMDVAGDRGNIILGNSPLFEPDEKSCLATFPFTLEKSCSDIEIRVWISENTSLRIKMIEICPLQR